METVSKENAVTPTVKSRAQYPAKGTELFFCGGVASWVTVELKHNGRDQLEYGCDKICLFPPKMIPNKVSRRDYQA